MIAFRKLFNRNQAAVIGMVHARALPGAPQNKLSMTEILDTACHEADTLSKAQVDGILLENMHDLPWLRPGQCTPETVAGMTAIATALRKQLPAMPIGVQILTAANKEALAVAKAAGLDFIRVEGFVFGHVGDEGWIQSCAAELLRYRKSIDAENVLLFTDIKKKHCSHAVTSDVSVMETAESAEMFLSDGIVVTGTATGKPTDLQDLQDVTKAVKVPVIVGSGVTSENVSQYMSANALIVGSHLKMYGLWDNELDPAQVKLFMAKVNKLREAEQAQDPTGQGHERGRDEAMFPAMTAQGE